MAHFAKLDENNIVQRVEVVHNNEAPTEEAGVAFLNKIHKTNAVWKQTSYNTYGGVHQLGGTPFRKNYAGPDYTYDAARDAFIPPQNASSWTLNETTCRWDPPIPKPGGPVTVWNEAAYQADNTKGWDESPFKDFRFD